MRREEQNARDCDRILNVLGSPLTKEQKQQLKQDFYGFLKSEIDLDKEDIRTVLSSEPCSERFMELKRELGI